MKKIIIAIFIFFWMMAQSLANQSDTLKKIDQNIQAVQTSLKIEKNKQQRVKKKLHQAKIAETHVHRALEKTKKILLLKQKKLQQLKQQTQYLQQNESNQEKELGTQIRAAYLLDQQPYLKRFLDLRDVEQSQRMLMYYHYISKSQIQAINALQKNLSDTHKNQSQLEQQYQDLITLKQNQLHNQSILKSTQNKNQQLIATLDQHIQTKNQKLQTLIQDKERLSKMVRSLNTTMAQGSLGHLRFAKLKGQLSWPTTGHIRHAFGTQIAQSELTWEGTVLSAPEGQAVHTIAAGRVIFAKWMSGYGLLLIINHGNGYMSLYGRNQTLAVQTNDWVTPNQTIATVGQSGGFDQSALYFSIRHNAQPLNPAHWCR